MGSTPADDGPEEAQAGKAIGQASDASLRAKDLLVLLPLIPQGRYTPKSEADAGPGYNRVLSPGPISPDASLR